MTLNVNTYADEFSAFGRFEFDHDRCEWNLVQYEVTSGHADAIETRDALWSQLERELELMADDQDWGLI